jgi:hypothetical protein
MIRAPDVTLWLRPIALAPFHKTHPGISKFAFANSSLPGYQGNAFQASSP